MPAGPVFLRCGRRGGRLLGVFLSAALLPGPYDADGDKETTVMACEADADAGLTSEIMKLVSGGQSTMFADVSYINDETNTFYLPNCGGMCTWFAARSDEPSENLKQVNECVAVEFEAKAKDMLKTSKAMKESAVEIFGLQERMEI